MTKILLDMDGVLVDQQAWFMKEVNYRFHTEYEYEDVVDFNYRRFMEKEHVDYIFKNLWNRWDLYEYTPPVKGAMEGVEELRKLGRVIVVSSPIDGHATSKARWLTKHGFSHDDRVLTRDKTLIPGDILIDDAIHNIEVFSGPCVLVDKPWNRWRPVNKDPYHPWWVATSWAEIPSLVEMALNGPEEMKDVSRKKVETVDSGPDDSRVIFQGSPGWKTGTEPRRFYSRRNLQVEPGTE